MICLSNDASISFLGVTSFLNYPCRKMRLYERDHGGVDIAQNGEVESSPDFSDMSKSKSV